MKYMAHRRFKNLAICGEVNIPAMTEVEESGGAIYHKGQMICYTDSENGHQFFSANEDGKGMERGHLTQAIQNRLAKQDSEHQKRWDRIWDDNLCQNYKEANSMDDWHWNDSFFSAPIEDLEKILALVGK